MANNSHSQSKNNSSQGKKDYFLIINTGPPKKKFIFEHINKNLGKKIVLVNQKLDFAKKYADYFIEADTYNYQEVIDKINTFLEKNPGVKFAGAITFFEDDIPVLARVCYNFRLTGNNLEAAENTRNKFKMCRALEKAGLPIPQYHLIKEEKDLENAISDIGFPAVLKPVWGADSEFVIRVNNKEEAQESYKYIIENATPKFNPIFKYNKSLVLYEEYVEGLEISLEGYSQFGIPHVVGILEKMPMREPYLMERGDVIPARLDRATASQAIKAAESALIALGVKDSLVHIEMRLTRKGPVLIEIASRLGGDYIWDWIKAIYEVDLIEVGLKICTNELVKIKSYEPKKYLVGKYIIPNQSGIITKIWGSDYVTKLKGIHDFHLHKKVGSPILVPPEGFENIGWIVGEGYSYNEAEKNMEKFFNALDIEICRFRPYSSIGRSYRKSIFSNVQIIRREIVDKSKIEKIRVVPQSEIKSLHVGILYNVFKKNGRNLVEQDLTNVGKNIQKSLESKGHKVTFFDMNESPLPIQKIQDSGVDIIFNVCERINESSLLEPHAASLLDILQMPYTGSSPFTLALCIDKIRVKKLLAYHEIPTPDWDYIYSLDEEIREDLKYPLIVKPANTDNSIGITNDSVVTTQKQLMRQLEKIITKYKRPALIEEYIEGDEYDVSVIGNEEDLKVLPFSRSIFDAMPQGYWHIYPFKAKWSKQKEKTAYDQIKVERPAKTSKHLADLISEMSIDTYNILGCHDYARMEIRVDHYNNPYVIDANPNPSINIDDCVPACAELIGLKHADFLEEIINLAIKRYKTNPPYYHLQNIFI